MQKIYIRQIDTPVGGMILGSYGNRLCLCDWSEEKRRERIDSRICSELGAEMVEGDSPVIRRAVSELGEYFAGRRKEFNIPVVFAGTDFQKKVWKKLMEIPYGETMSYSEMAASLGCPTSVRAVANANGANAISIFVPCHRVIGIDGALIGYGGGLDAKKFLLSLELGESTPLKQDPAFGKPSLWKDIRRRVKRLFH